MKPGHLCANFFILIPIVFLGTLPVYAANQPHLLADSALRDFIPTLKKGGYVIYMRHTATDHTQEDVQPVNLKDCTTQRMLSETGRKQARWIGQAFRDMNIPIHEIHSSPFCRCIETAQLSFGAPQVNDSLYFVMSLTREEREKKSRILNELLHKIPPGGTNEVIVAHTANLQEAIGIWPKPEGVIHIFKSDDNHSFSEIYAVLPETWKTITRKSGKDEIQ